MERRSSRSASFHVAEDGANHQFARPDVPAPDEGPLWQDRLREFGDRVPTRWLRPRPVEVRHIGGPPWVVCDPAAAGDAHTKVWMRAVGPLPDDPLLHVCAAVYASDLTLLDSVLAAPRLAWVEGSMTGDSALTGATLDHAKWFHAPFRADGWLLYVQEAPVASGARGLARGHVYRHDGQLVVSVVQDRLVRVTSGNQS